jgi:3-hydroxyacyl-[acyl-carrier-protein] dehydratase
VSVVTDRATATAAAVRLTARDDSTARGEVLIDAGDPVFAGHYPGFPVLPGVHLIEFADQTARAWRGRAGDTLVAVERCRFLRPVYGGDQLTVDLTVTPTGSTDPGAETELRYSAAVRGPAGPVADIRLRYRTGDLA